MGRLWSKILLIMGVSVFLLAGCASGSGQMGEKENFGSGQEVEGEKSATGQEVEEEDIVQSFTEEGTSLATAREDADMEMDYLDPETGTDEISSDMEVHFIDVGQGDATLIKAQGHYMLIDAGENDKGTMVQNYLQNQGVDKLDYLILTHTDADHIGGADVIINKFPVDNLFIGDYKKDNNTYEDLMNAIAYKNLTYSTPAVGVEYMLGNAVFTIVAPNGTYDDPNNNSIALVLQNGKHSFLFTGDCEEEAEEDIIKNGINIDCDVYKLGHHGSRTASSRAFLEVITPVYGVVSCGEDNSYGHPHAEPLNNLREMGVQLFRTDEQGSVVAYSDGEELTWNCAPSDTWKAGEPQGGSDVSGEAGEESEEITEETERTVEENPEQSVAPDQPGSIIANKNSGAFHTSDCSRLPKEKNRVYFNSPEEAMAAGYDNPCDYCNP